MILLPIQNKYSQLNTSDRFGSIWYTKNCNFDEEGYLSLSSRTFSIASQLNEPTEDLGIPLSFGRHNGGGFYITTTDGLFNTNINSTTLSITEDVGGNVPAGTFNSGGRWWQNRWHSSTQTTIRYKTSGAWTNTSITLATGKTHVMEVFRNRNTLCVTNGNIVQQYATDYSMTNPNGGTYAQLTLPSDYEAVGLAYCNNKMGVITRLGTASEGQNQDAYFFWWDGSTAEANGGVPIGSDTAVALTAYKASWVVVSRTGQWLYFNGSQFQQIAAFPFYYQKVVLGDFLNKSMYGDCLRVEGDLIYMNTFMDFSDVGPRLESNIANNPSGIWCYDPDIGLYHKYSPSISPILSVEVNAAAIEPATDTITVNLDVKTGTPILYSNAAATPIGGLTVGRVYYAINVSATSIKLADVYSESMTGLAVDITNDGSGSQYFYIPEIVDYGATSTQRSGGLSIMGMNSPVYDHMIFGGDYFDAEQDNDFEHLVMTVPEFPNIGYFVSPRIFSPNITDINQKLYVSFNKLNDGDSITVKYRDKFYSDLSASVPNSSGLVQSSKAEWISNTIFTTSSNLAGVKSIFDNLEEREYLEVELLGGMGAGQSAIVTNIVVVDGEYSITIDLQLDGVATGGFSVVLFSNWTVGGTIDSSSPNNQDGFAEVPIGTSSRFIQYKVEMRGVDVTIESLQIINSKNQESK